MNPESERIEMGYHSGTSKMPEELRYLPLYDLYQNGEL